LRGEYKIVCHPEWIVKARVARSLNERAHDTADLGRRAHSGDTIKKADPQQGADKMSREDEIRDVLNNAAKDISSAQSNPRTWLPWVVYLLARLEEKATNENPANKESYMEMLSALQDELRNRMRTGGWH
jgi:hypothetical protein